MSVSLMKLKLWSCRYPLDDDERGVSMQFCGEPADADGDGLADGLEYAFSTDPTQPSALADSVAVTVDRMEISRDLPVERGDVNYGAEWTDDLATWSSQDVEVRIEGGKIIASAPRGGSSRMMRWVVGEK